MEPTPRIERGSVAYHATALPLSYADSKYRYFRHACSVWPAIRNIPRLVWIVNCRGIRKQDHSGFLWRAVAFLWLHFCSRNQVLPTRHADPAPSELRDPE